MQHDDIDSTSTIEGGYEPFRVKSFGENIAINLGMIFVTITITALILSMLLLPHPLVGVTWNGG